MYNHSLPKHIVSHQPHACSCARSAIVAVLKGTFMLLMTVEHNISADGNMPV
jgi:hypothetical protein